MKKKILNNLGLKLLSIVIAVVLWFVVVMTNNPKDSKEFRNIPVVLTNVELLTGEDKVYEVLDNTDIVRVTVEMPRDKMDQISESDIVAEADVSKLTEINTVPISCYVTNDSLNVSSITCNRDVVRLSVEDKISRTFNIEPVVIGEAAEGYVVDKVSGNLTRLQITGPRSVIEKIKKVQAEVDVSNAVSNISVNVEPRFYDEEGKVLNDPRIIKTDDTVHLDVRVLATKEVPLEVSFTGTPAEGYLATGEVSCEPSTVMIAGTLPALASVNKIVIPAEDVDITGATADYTATISLQRYFSGMSDVNLLDGGSTRRAVVTVRIEAEAERTLIIPERNIRIVSLPEGFEAQLERGEEPFEPYELTVSGLGVAVSAVSPDSLTGTVDIGKWMENQNMEELSVGIYEIPVRFELPNNVNTEKELVVRINIIELEDEE